jgi:hypothetical protein
MVKEKVCEGKADGHRGRERERERCPAKGCIYMTPVRALQSGVLNAQMGYHGALLQTVE